MHVLSSQDKVTKVLFWILFTISRQAIAGHKSRISGGTRAQVNQSHRIGGGVQRRTKGDKISGLQLSFVSPRAFLLQQEFERRL